VLERGRAIKLGLCNDPVVCYASFLFAKAVVKQQRKASSRISSAGEQKDSWPLIFALAPGKDVPFSFGKSFVPNHSKVSNIGSVENAPGHKASLQDWSYYCYSAPSYVA
jgi:hypothetical protein